MNANDKEIIDLQKKKISQLKVELSKYNEKYDTLKRNYGSIKNSNPELEKKFIMYKKSCEEMKVEIDRLTTDNSAYEEREIKFKKELERLLEANLDLEEKFAQS